MLWEPPIPHLPTSDGSGRGDAPPPKEQGTHEPGTVPPANPVADPKSPADKLALDQNIDDDPKGPIGEVRQFPGHTNEIRRLAVSSDGKQLLTAGWDKSTRLWDVASGRQLGRWYVHDDWVHGIAFMPNGRQGVSCGKNDKIVRLFDLKNGHRLGSYTGPKLELHYVSVSGDGHLVAACGPEPLIFIWDSETGKVLQQLPEPVENVNAVALSTHGDLALSGGAAGVVRLWDVKTGTELRRFKGHPGGTMGVAFSQDDKYAVSCGTDKVVRLWEVETGNQVQQFTGHESAVNSVAFSPDGLRLLSGGLDGSVRLWDTACGKELHSFKGHKGHVWSVAFSAGGGYAFSAGQDTVARMWRLPPVAEKLAGGPIPPAGQPAVDLNTLPTKPVLNNPNAKTPVPNDMELAAAWMEAKETYKEAYAKVKRDDLLALAKRMLKDGIDTKDTKDKLALRYFLLREAGDLAAGFGDLPFAFALADETSKLYLVNENELKAARLELADQHAATNADHLNVTLFALAVADEAQEQDAFETAERALKVAKTDAPQQPAILR